MGRFIIVLSQVIAAASFLVTAMMVFVEAAVGGIGVGIAILFFIISFQMLGEVFIN